MKLKRSTVVLVGIALLMVAGVLITESQRDSTSPTAEVEGTGGPIFLFEESAVTRLQVERDGTTLVFEKDDEGNWQMVEPDPGPAEPGAVAYLLSRLNTDSPLQRVAMQPGDLEDFGLANPAGTVIVTLEDGTEHQLLLGGEDFSGSARYAVIDPETWPPAPDTAEEISVLVVSQDVANGINRPVEEWQMPVEAAEPEDDPTEAAEAEADGEPAPDSSGAPDTPDVEAAETEATDASGATESAEETTPEDNPASSAEPEPEPEASSGTDAPAPEAEPAAEEPEPEATPE